MNTSTYAAPSRVPWNKGKLTGQKPPLKLKEIWAIRVRLQLACSVRDMAMFNLAIDSKLRACDLTKLRVRDVRPGERVSSRATIMQQKTQRPVQFEITEQTRDSVEAWIAHAGLHPTDFLFPSRIHASPHLSTRQYARLVHRWIASPTSAVNGRRLSRPPFKEIVVSEPGDVIVIDAQTSASTTLWRENMTLSAMNRGLVAAVIDGASRDVPKIRRLRLTVVCRGIVPNVAAIFDQDN